MAIILPSGFNVTNSDPVDARFALANQTARYALSAANIYKGLVVFQQDNSTLWVLTDTTNVGNINGWTQIQIGTVTSNLPSGIISSSQQVIDIFNANFTSGSTSNAAHTGWVSLVTYTDAFGNPRVKSEVLAALSKNGITSDDEDTKFPD